MRINLDDAICAAVFASSGAFNTKHDTDAAGAPCGATAPEPNRRGFGVKTPRRLRRIMTRVARRLELNAAQRAEIKSIIETERPTIGPLVRQLFELRQERRSVPPPERFMQILEARHTAAQRDRIKVELAVARERVKVQVYYALTAEQRAKAAKMFKHLEAHLQQPFSGHAA